MADDSPAQPREALPSWSPEAIRRRLAENEVAGRPKDRKRGVSMKVREVRERLTSTTGTRRAFDLELARLYAMNRLASAVPLALTGVAASGVLLLWLPVSWAAGWGFAVLASLLLLVVLARRFDAQASEQVSVRKWQSRFAGAEFLHALAIGSLVPLLGHAGADASRIFLFFAMLLAGALVTTLAASLPAAAYAGAIPLTLAIVLYFAGATGPTGPSIAIMAALGQLFLIYLGQRLFRTSLLALQFRAEKDALIAELEQANAHSDEARYRAETANVAKSRFLATMSHELRTPLNAILGFSEVMKDEVLGPHANQTYREYASDIHSSGQHLLNLINEILDLSRVEAGRYELNEEAVNLAYLVEDCRHLLSLRAKSRGIVIDEIYEPDLPMLWADERAVRQITLNLLSNAIKFTPQDGTIVLTVGWTEDGGQYLSIRDSGPGIPEDEIPMVLSSFGQGSLAMKTAEQGAGLGLPIVKGLVDLHGGNFMLRSKLREGTEAIIAFPASRVMSALPPITQDRDEPHLRRSA